MLQLLALGAVQEQPDPWGFEDAPVETWAEILADRVLGLPREPQPDRDLPFRAVTRG